jgi:band 7 protein CG42540
MAAEAEAAREARAKVIAAEGEQRASRALKEAAEVIADSPAALQLRYLQTLNSIAAEKNSTIVFPVPMELFRGFVIHNNNNNNHNNYHHHHPHLYPTAVDSELIDTNDEFFESKTFKSE